MKIELIDFIKTYKEVVLGNEFMDLLKFLKAINDLEPLDSIKHENVVITKLYNNTLKIEMS